MGSTLLATKAEHPWLGTDGWETRQYRSSSHEAAKKDTSQMISEGWSSWIVSNDGEPGFVVFRRTGQVVI